MQIIIFITVWLICGILCALYEVKKLNTKDNIILFLKLIPLGVILLFVLLELKFGEDDSTT